NTSENSPGTSAGASIEIRAPASDMSQTVQLRSCEPTPQSTHAGHWTRWRGDWRFSMKPASACASGMAASEPRQPPWPRLPNAGHDRQPRLLNCAGGPTNFCGDRFNFDGIHAAKSLEIGRRHLQAVTLRFVVVDPELRLLLGH